MSSVLPAPIQSRKTCKCASHARAPAAASAPCRISQPPRTAKQRASGCGEGSQHPPGWGRDWCLAVEPVRPSGSAAPLQPHARIDLCGLGDLHCSDVAENVPGNVVGDILTLRRRSLGGLGASDRHADSPRVQGGASPAPPFFLSSFGCVPGLSRGHAAAVSPPPSRILPSSS